LLHSSFKPLHEDELCAWAEHSNKAIYRRDVLRRAHREKLLEYDEITRVATLSPAGIADVETRILKKD